MASAYPNQGGQYPIPGQKSAVQDIELEITDAVDGQNDYQTMDEHAPAPAGAAHDTSRMIFVNSHQTQKFGSNKISTAKYSIFSFLPKFLFEQFRKYANLFFLFIALMQQIPNVSPTGRYTTAVPLVMIMCVSALKEMYEDIKRHRADSVTNRRKVSVHRNNSWVSVIWQDVVVGDIVKVDDGGPFPGDLILLSSSEPLGMCYIETCNLDGETNLKLRQGVEATSHLVTGDSLSSLKGMVECEPPNRHLYDFAGTIRVADSRAIAVGPDQILLRGAQLKNTDWIFGIVIYTGHQSKLMLNSYSTPLKRSNVEKETNTQIIFLFVILLVISLVCAAFNSVWTSKNEDTHWYLYYSDLSGNNFGFNLLTFIILYNNLIPISLQVTLEMVKFMQAIFINWDKDMYYARTGTSATARTSNLNEELGQIKFLFSDKTGTLTQNIMTFRKCSIAGTVYEDSEELDDFRGAGVVDALMAMKDGHEKEVMCEYLRLLAVCHTVVPQIKAETGDIAYLASSPDEAALVQAAKVMKHVFTTRTPSNVLIEVLGAKEKYQILNVLEFTSKRKRMSVVVKTPEGSIKLYCKGADNVIYDRLGNKQYTGETMGHLETFAAVGLRTLCLAYVDISPEFYEEWAGTFYKASTALKDRELKLEEAAELIETNLTLLGATAIEDKLQDGVPETIATLAAADIKIWVLTGDKQETAINIGYSCKLLTPNMDLIIINEVTLDATRDVLVRHKASFGDQLGKENLVALIIDGQSLKHALTHDCQKDFLDISLSCKAVICCRVSPLQKAEIVELVKNSQSAITLAIGDGANDVGMIQAAHVGVGISGEEGMQAACASDYSIGQFRFLQKLLLVHGAWSYSRVCKLVLYSFYKNICLYLTQFWFTLENGYSGQSLFEKWTLSFYNVIFTSAPPLAIGLFDRYCSADTMMKNPLLYKDSQNGKLFNKKVFWLWMFNSIFHSLMIWWMTAGMLQHDVAWENGKTVDHFYMGNYAYTYTVVVVCLKAGLEITAWTYLTHLAIWGSIACWFIFLPVYSSFFSWSGIAPEFSDMFMAMVSSYIFWAGLVLVPTACLVRDYAWKAFKRDIFKTHRHAIQEMELANKEVKIEGAIKKRLKPFSERARLLSRTIMNIGGDRRSAGSKSRSDSANLPHGYAFAQEEGGVVSQTEFIRSYDTREVKPTGE